MSAREALAGPGSAAQQALIFLLALNRRRVSDAADARTRDSTPADANVAFFISGDLYRDRS
jgi:hypothetical protein